MTFREVPVGGEFWHGGHFYRKTGDATAVQFEPTRLYFQPANMVEPVAPPPAEAVVCLEPDGHRPYGWHQEEGGG